MDFKKILPTWAYVASSLLAVSGAIVTVLSRDSFGNGFGHPSGDPDHTLGLQSLSGVYKADLEVVADFESGPIHASSSRVSAQQLSTQGLVSRLRSEIAFIPSPGGVDMTFANMAVEVGGLLEGSLSAELAQTHVHLKTGPGGNLTEFGITVGVSTQTVAIVSQLLAQLKMPASMPASRVDVVEQDMFGRFEARYEWNESRSTLNRRKIRYLKLDPRSFGDASEGAIAPGQEWMATFDPSGLKSVQSADTLIVTKNGHNVLRQAVGFTMKRIDGRTPPTQSLSQPMTWLPYRPGFLAEYRDPKLVEQIFRQELGDVSEGEILRTLPRVTNREDEVHWYRKVRAFIHLHPERSEAFIPLLQAAPVDSIAMQVVAPALGRIGHKEAQTTLRRLITLRLDDGKATAPLFPLLVQSPEPTQETVQFVRSMVDSQSPLTGSSALLALGKLAATTRDVAPDTSRAIVAELKSRLGTEHRSDVLRTLIFAAANSQSPAFIGDLTAIIARTSDPRIKGHAVEAIGGLAGDEAFAKLKDYLKTSEPTLQLHALIALALQPYDPGLETDVRTLAKEHASPEVRTAALDWVFQHRDLVQNASRLFQERRDRDPDLSVRKRAASLLEVQ